MCVDDAAGNICLSLTWGWTTRPSPPSSPGGGVQVAARVGCACSQSLKVTYDKLLSSFAFEFTSRPDNLGVRRRPPPHRARGRGARQGLLDVARHATGCHITQETRVQNASGDAASRHGGRPWRWARRGGTRLTAAAWCCGAARWRPTACSCSRASSPSSSPSTPPRLTKPPAAGSGPWQGLPHRPLFSST